MTTDDVVELVKRAGFEVLATGPNLVVGEFTENIVEKAMGLATTLSQTEYRVVNQRPSKGEVYVKTSVDGLFVTWL